MTQHPLDPLPNPHEPDPQPSTSGGLKVLGFVLGFVFGFVVAFFAFTSSGKNPISGWGLAILCLVLSIVVLAVKSLRTAGAGLLAGIAIGFITLADVCGGLFGVLVISNR